LAQEQEKLFIKVVNEKEKRKSHQDEEISFSHGNYLLDKP
jgi:hypothetical protein